MMFAEQLPTDNIAILCDDTDQAVHIFGMLPNQVR